MPQAVLQTAKTPDNILRFSQQTQLLITNKIGLRKISVVTPKEVEQYTELMAKNKKPLEFVIEFDGAWFTYLVRIGTFKRACNEINIIEDSSITDKAKVVQNLVLYGAANQKQVEQLKERNLI